MSDDTISKLIDFVPTTISAAAMIEKLREENERLSAEVTRLHSAHETACAGGDLLRAEVERLRGALKRIAGKAPFADDPWKIARDALEGGR